VLLADVYQLNDIRISIPKTIAVLPMLTSPSDPFVQSPNAVFKDFAMSAVNAAQQVKDIQENWRSQATAGILEKVRDSVARDGDIQVQNLAHKRVKSPFDIKVERTSFQDEAHNATQGSDNALGSMKEEEDRIDICQILRSREPHSVTYLKSRSRSKEFWSPYGSHADG
jgi:hypothetical protein